MNGGVTVSGRIEKMSVYCSFSVASFAFRVEIKRSCSSSSISSWESPDPSLSEGYLKVLRRRVVAMLIENTDREQLESTTCSCCFRILEGWPDASFCRWTVQTTDEIVWA